MSVTCLRSIGQLQFDASTKELRYLASRTIFSDSHLARIVLGLINVFLLGFCSLLTGEIIFYCSRMYRSLFFLFLYRSWYFTCSLFVLKTTSILSRRCSDECIFPTLNLDVT